MSQSDRDVSKLTRSIKSSTVGNDFPNQDVKSFSYEKLKEIMKKADDPSYQINDDIMKKPINEAE